MWTLVERSATFWTTRYCWWCWLLIASPRCSVGHWLTTVRYGWLCRARRTPTTASTRQTSVWKKTPSRDTARTSGMHSLCSRKRGYVEYLAYRHHHHHRRRQIIRFLNNVYSIKMGWCRITVTVGCLPYDQEVIGSSPGRVVPDSYPIWVEPTIITS